MTDKYLTPCTTCFREARFSYRKYFDFIQLYLKFNRKPVDSDRFFLNALSCTFEILYGKKNIVLIAGYHNLDKTKKLLLKKVNGLCKK